MKPFFSPTSSRKATSSTTWRRLAPESDDKALRVLGVVTFIPLCLVVLGAVLEGGSGRGALVVYGLAMLAPMAYGLLYLPRRGLYASTRGLLILNNFSVRRIAWPDIDDVRVTDHKFTMPGTPRLECVSVVVGGKEYPVSSLSRPVEFKNMKLSPALAAKRGEFSRYDDAARELDALRKELSR